MNYVTIEKLITHVINEIFKSINDDDNLSIMDRVRYRCHYYHHYHRYYHRYHRYIKDSKE